MDPQEERTEDTAGNGDADGDTVVDEFTTKNGEDAQEENGLSGARSGTSSPSGRSGTPHSDKSDGSRRRVESDAVKEVARSASPKSRRRRKDTKSPPRKTRSRTPSPSPRRVKRERSPSPRRSRSRSGSRRHNDRDRDRDSHRRNGGSDKRRRSRSPRHRSRSPRRRTRSPPRHGGSRYGRNSERDNPRPSRCIGVFGLSTRTREKDLREEFDKYGPLDNVQLIHDHKTGRSRGFGFVYFAYLQDAQTARDAANGMIMDDRRIRVDFSLTQRNRSPPRSSPRERSSRSRSPVRRRRTRSRSIRRSRSRSYRRS